MMMIRTIDMLIQWKDRPFPSQTNMDDTYMINKVIGVGSYGFAYLATHLPSNQEVLLKQLRKRIKVTNLSFQYEMEALSSLSHESIPVLLDSFTWGKKQ